MDEEATPFTPPVKRGRGWPKGRPRPNQRKKPTDETVHLSSEEQGVFASALAASVTKVAPPKPKPPATTSKHVLRDPSEYPVDENEGLRFHIPRAQWPDGFALQWQAVSVWNQVDPSLRAESEQKGWNPVCTGDFDGKFDGRFIPAGRVGEEIMIGGQVLVARPMSWDEKARGIAKREAEGQVNIKKRQLQAGQIDGVSLDTRHPSALAQNRITSEMERVHLPPPPKE